tara:strand:- start:283 stop:462 length:180 start_codon:yes stop_codon:yes gene_type:complete
MSDTMVIKVELEVRELAVGEIVKATDFYLSSSGSWEPVPIAGHAVLDNGVRWARSTKDE